MTPDWDPRLVSALIAALVVAAGWAVTGWRERGRDRRRRDQRIRDVQRALYAEIRAYVAALERDDLAQYGAHMQRRILEEEDFFPLIPRENNASIFEAIVGDIHILPRRVIDPVALYYSQLVAIQLMIEDLRVLEKSKLGPQRAAAIYGDYIAMKLAALDMGREALIMMGGYIEGGPAGISDILRQREKAEQMRLARAASDLRSEIEAAKLRLNSRGEGRCGP